jgi:hypothetical protein
MRLLISFFVVMFFAFLSAYLAKQRGRDPVAWFMIGILLGIFSPLLLFILKPLNASSGIGGDTEEDENIKLAPPEENIASAYIDKVWFYLDSDHQQQGPVSFSFLKSISLEQKITPATYVWTEGMEQWKRIRELPGFVESL